MRVLVLTNGPLFASSVGTCLGEAGYDVDVIAAHRWCGFRLSRHCGRFVSVAPALLKAESPRLVEQIQEHCRKRDIKVVVPADFQFVAFLARHGHMLKNVAVFPVPQPDTLQRLHNKWQLSRTANEHGVAHPATELLESPEQIHQLDLEFPLIVKPLEGHSAIGVYEVHNPEDLAALLEDDHARVELPVLVQEYIDGPDFDLTLLADQGEVVAWTLQRRDAPTAAGEMFFLADDRILEMGRTLMRATGYHGVIDFDLRADRHTGVPYVTDGNPRFPGSLRYKMWAGVNLPHLGVLVALGKDARSLFHPAAGAYTDYTVSPKRLLLSMLRGRLTSPDMSPEKQGAWKHSLRDPIPHLAASVYHSVRRRFENEPTDVNVARRYSADESGQ